MAAPCGERLNSTTFGLLAAGTIALWVCADRSAAHAQFTSGVSVIEVYAAVADQNGEPVKGLTASDFEVLEDGKPQKISVFAAADFPLNVALALDRSFSMAGERLNLTKKAAHIFIDALRPEDRVRIVRIGSEFEAADARVAQHAAIDQIDAWGTTALHDSIIQSLDLIEGDGPARGRHALVLFSDGTDRYSRATAADVLNRARQANVIVYPIAIGRERPPLFAELAALTGGRSVHLREGKGLGEAAQEIARELRFQYLLGYAPARPLTEDRGSWRSIQVRVERKGVRVRARDGYLVK
jgi:Ca-activated chloride channel family protein